MDQKVDIANIFGSACAAEIVCRTSNKGVF
jgi:hypothetical protein